MSRSLVADDEVIERKVLVKKLRQKFGEENVEFYEAENGREVLKRYDEKGADILLLDIEMPGITGLEAAEQIRRKDENCAILFLTAFNEFDYARKAISVHALDYLLKPYDETELFLSIDSAMHYVDKVNEGKLQPLPAVETAGGESAHAVHAENDTISDEAHAEREEGGEDKIVARMRHFVETHYMEDISVLDIASAFGYSEAYFCKLFKQNFGKNFVTYLTEYRVELAKRELADLSCNVKEIGQRVGYTDSNYFTKVFRRITGMSPSEYRNHLT